MATRKQMILPFVVLAVGIGGFIAISSMKKPPAEKEEVDNTPIVAVTEISKAPMNYSVSSYGLVKAKYETELVSQVNGEILFLADEFVRGGFVKKGAILAKIDPSDYEANLLDAEAALASAKATLVQERAFGKVAEEEWKRIENGVPTELSLRKPQLAQELAKLNSAEAGLKRAKRDLERTFIRAPYDALIESRHIGLGSYVSKGSMLGKVYSTDDAEIRLPIGDKELRYLDNRGQNATVTISGEYSGEQHQWQATIVRSEGVIDDNSRMTYLVADVKDPYALLSDKKQLRFGTYVTAQIKGSQAGSVTRIPRHLVVADKVAIVSSDNKLKYQTVDVLRQVGSEVIIADGLEPGMKIITSALDYPVEGMAVALMGEQDSLIEDKNTDTQLAMDDKE
ncbi:efflux RND transporter periplasmic adaptor subunit [Shewanella sp. Scap07]|uniref:efflux RND transporter periplasmic adaptor subunit n=1 Tax=Shewanella sp. Scap07 TaxID=2589987 RepID=UPI0015B8C9AD|nr:efflux RND transporter periplasmic adaptor subunit [Shewanella sp. Scap07]QLE85611.1 efflux RND transporter periplasmic adaptor subunit [Shewanella sp. Scap07]